MVGPRGVLVDVCGRLASERAIARVRVSEVRVGKRESERVRG